MPEIRYTLQGAFGRGIDGVWSVTSADRVRRGWTMANNYNRLSCFPRNFPVFGFRSCAAFTCVFEYLARFLAPSFSRRSLFPAVRPARQRLSVVMGIPSRYAMSVS